jgi:hypothetical protein
MGWASPDPPRRDTRVEMPQEAFLAVLKIEGK